MVPPDEPKEAVAAEQTPTAPGKADQAAERKGIPKTKKQPIEQPPETHDEQESQRDRSLERESWLATIDARKLARGALIVGIGALVAGIGALVVGVLSLPPQGPTTPTPLLQPTPISVPAKTLYISPNTPIGGQLTGKDSQVFFKVINIPENCARMFLCLLKGSPDVEFILYQEDNRLRTGVLEEVGRGRSACLSPEPKNFFQYYILVRAINESGEFLLSVDVEEPIASPTPVKTATIGVTTTISTPTSVLPEATSTMPVLPTPTPVLPTTKPITLETPLATPTGTPMPTHMPPATPIAVLSVTPAATPTATPSMTPSATPTTTPIATPATGSICVLVYNDLNGNGLLDLSEPLLAGATITITNYSGAFVGVYTTDVVHEPYCFTGLAPDTYQVKEQNLPGYPSSTTPDIWTVPLSAGSAVTIAFGDQAPPTSTPTATPITQGTPTATLVTTVLPTATPTTLETPIRRYTPTVPPETPVPLLLTATPITQTYGTPIRAYTPTLPSETPVLMLSTPEVSESGSGRGTLGLATTSLPPGSGSTPNKQDNIPEGRFEMGTSTSLTIGLALLCFWIITTSIAIYLPTHLGYGHKANRLTATAAIVAASAALVFAILMWKYPVIPTQLLLKFRPSVELHQAEAAAHQYSIMVTPSKPVSGMLGKSDQVRFSINVPDGSDYLVIHVNSSEADLKFGVFKGNNPIPIGTGSVDKPVTIQNPEPTTYYILLSSQRASTSFTLLAEIERSASKS